MGGCMEFGCTIRGRGIGGAQWGVYGVGQHNKG